jgi:hypothetical protein
VTDSVELQLAKVVDDSIARRDPTLPTWAAARVTRLLRELDAGERREVVERLCARAQMSASLTADIRTAAERAAGPAPPPPPAPRAAPAAGPVTAHKAKPAPARAASRARGVRARTVRTRTLGDVPHGTLVEYQGRSAVVEPPWLVLDDGRKFQFLSPAALYVNGGVEVNGWDVWKVADGRSMAECHDTGSWLSTE